MSLTKDFLYTVLEFFTFDEKVNILYAIPQEYTPIRHIIDKGEIVIHDYNNLLSHKYMRYHYRNEYFKIQRNIIEECTNMDCIKFLVGNRMRRLESLYTAKPIGSFHEIFDFPISFFKDNYKPGMRCKCSNSHYYNFFLDLYDQQLEKTNNLFEISENIDHIMHLYEGPELTLDYTNEDCLKDCFGYDYNYVNELSDDKFIQRDISYNDSGSLYEFIKKYENSDIIDFKIPYNLYYYVHDVGNRDDNRLYDNYVEADVDLENIIYDIIKKSYDSMPLNLFSYLIPYISDKYWIRISNDNGNNINMLSEILYDRHYMKALILIKEYRKRKIEKITLDFYGGSHIFHLLIMSPFSLSIILDNIDLFEIVIPSICDIVTFLCCCTKYEFISYRSICYLLQISLKAYDRKLISPGTIFHCNCYDIESPVKHYTEVETNEISNDNIFQLCSYGIDMEIIRGFIDLCKIDKSDILNHLMDNYDNNLTFNETIDYLMKNMIIDEIQNRKYINKLIDLDNMELYQYFKKYLKRDAKVYQREYRLYSVYYNMISDSIIPIGGSYNDIFQMEVDISNCEDINERNKDDMISFIREFESNIEASTLLKHMSKGYMDISNELLKHWNIIYDIPKEEFEEEMMLYLAQ